MLMPEKWSITQKWLFRFFAVYLFIYIFPFPVNLILDSQWQSFGSLFDPCVNWVAHHMLHLKQHVHVDNNNGSGDTSYYYVQEFLFIIMAIAATIIWSVADRRRSNYTKLLYWVKVMVRYYLAFVLLAYGFDKFNGDQFPVPDFYRLMEPYGKSSPMGLAWAFLGFSKAFGFFMGFSECIGGILMLFRRTTLFGACIATTVVMNIVMINFCFDVPVKLFSGHLLLMCLFVLCTEGSRFLDLFIFNKPVQPLDLSPFFQSRKMRIARKVVKAIIILAFIGLPLFQLIQEMTDSDNMKAPLYGIYDVKTFTRDNDTIPPLTTDSTRWSKLIISNPGYATIQTMTEKNKYYVFKPDTVHKTVIMYPSRDTAIKYTLSYKREDSSLNLYGILDRDSIYVKTEWYDERKYLLMNRGFHWINEHPFNR